MEDATIVLHSDLINLIWTVAIAAGAGIISVVSGAFILGRKMERHTNDLNALREQVQANSAGLLAHEQKCDTREEERQKDVETRNHRLDEGSKKMALLKSDQDHIKEDIAEVKADVKELLKRRH